MADIQNLCPGCMRKMKRNKGQNHTGVEKAGGKCPYCGFDITTYKANPRCLPVNTILAGKYLVGKVLGEGGFGITYIGYDLNMQTRIAIKEYFPVELVSRDTTQHITGSDRVISLSGDKSVTYQQGLKKYVAEAQNVSQFSELPGVVSVKDFFYENETAYIVMEYIEGMSLKEYLKQHGGKLSEEETLSIMKPVLEALVQVHKAGIVHRDISPDNIMLTFEKTDTDATASKTAVTGTSSAGSSTAGAGRIASVKLIDFGAARMTAKNDQKSLTIILKHGYAPEEQYRTHGEQGAWTDVYALCATMYRMLTGTTPQPAMDRLFSDELKSPAAMGAEVKKSTDAVLMQGLAVKKENRIQSVDELLAVLYEGKKSRKSVGKFGSKKAAFLAAGVGITAVLLLGGFFLLGNRDGADVKSEQAGTGDNASGLIETENISGEEASNTAETTAQENVNTSDSQTELTLTQNENPVVEQIVWSKAETMIAAGNAHILSLRDDGTVLAAGNNDFRQCEVTDWDSVAAVYAAENLSAGLRVDGTVLIAGSDLIQDGVSSWKDVIKLAVSGSHILGLTKDGKVLSAGNNFEGCCETGDWENIKNIGADINLSWAVKDDGTLLTAGMLPRGTALPEAVKQWKNLKQLIYFDGPNVVIGVCSDGTLLCEGDKFNFVENAFQLTNVVKLTIGNGFLNALTESGDIIPLFDSNKVVRNSATNQKVKEWKNIAAVAATSDCQVALTKDGTVLVSEPAIYGNSTLKEILSLENAVQTEWTKNGLVVLCSDGKLKATGYCINWEKADEEKFAYTDIASINSSASYFDFYAAVTQDGKVVRPEASTVSYSRSEGENITVEELNERKNRTPRLYENWENVKHISISDDHIAALFEDGTVKAAGLPEQQTTTDYQTGLTMVGTCETDNWENVRQVLALRDATYGVTEEGKILVAGEKKSTQQLREQCENLTGIRGIWGYGGSWPALAVLHQDGTAEYLKISDYGDNGQKNIENWTDLTQLAVGKSHTAGLREDGTVVAAGSNFAGQCDLEEWTEVVQISVGDSGTAGVTKDGRVMLAGTLPNDFYVAEKWAAVTVPEP